MAAERFPLNVPRTEPVALPRNPIHTAVCELRFPTLVELEERGPAIAQRRLRKIYPHFEPGSAVQIGPGSDFHREKRFVFKSKLRDSSVSLRASAIALETDACGRFEEFARRLREVLDVTSSLIDSDFFTRVGLRYINMLPTGGSPGGWINPMLIAPLSTVYTAVSTIFGKKFEVTQVLATTLSDTVFSQPSRTNPPMP